MSNESEKRFHLINKFFVRIVRMGDRYGRRDCLTHPLQDPLIEVRFGPRGRFMSRFFYCSTIMDNEYPTGLSLYDGVPAWGLTADTMLQVKEFIRHSLSMPTA